MALKPGNLKRAMPTMRTICGGLETVQGIDVSAYQPTVDWARAAAQGIQFAFCKAGEGASKDGTFFKHKSDAKLAGLLVGAYWFYHPSQNAITQAELFASLTGKLGSGDLPCVLDWETTDGLPSSTDMVNGLAFLNRVQTLTGKPPIIYGAPYFLQALNLDSRFQPFSLWVAHYGVKCPLVPSAFSTWSFWQYGTFSLSGVTVDGNYFNGGLDRLKLFAS